MRLKVGVPYAKHGRITDATINSLKALENHHDIETRIILQASSNIPRARNAMINGEKTNLIKQELSDFDFFLCVDADTGFTVENVEQLLAHDSEIVSGAYPHKHDKSRLTAGWFSDIEGLSPMEKRVGLDATGLFEVDWAGAGFLLIKREVLERSPYPWFTSEEVHYSTKEGQCAQLVSEDIGFCMKMRRNGEKILFDADCRVEHVSHPNETPGADLGQAINDLLKNRETIIRHVQAMSDENRKLRDMLRTKNTDEKM